MATSSYKGIRSLKDLRYQRRLLASHIDHQEIMISYHVRNLKDNISPLRLLTMGFQTLAAYNPYVNSLYKGYCIVRSLIKNRKG